jgi:MarR family transcriptional regulator for hemolysin
MNGSGDKFGALLLDIQRFMRSIMDRRLKPLGLSQAKWRALLQISKFKDGINQTELAALTCVETPTMARLLDRLQKDGWVKRYDSPTDRRVKIVRLLKKADSVMKIIGKTANDARDELLSDIPPKDMESLIHTLEKMRTKAERMQKNAVC